MSPKSSPRCGRLVSQLPKIPPQACRQPPLTRGGSDTGCAPSVLTNLPLRMAGPSSRTHRWLRATARSICRRNILQVWQLQLSTLPMASTSSCPARPQAQWNHL